MARLGTAGKPLAGKRATAFNRSEVVGRPLASTMANDGGEVVSFDLDGVQAFQPRKGGPPRGDERRSASAYCVSESTSTRVPSNSLVHHTPPPVRIPSAGRFYAEQTKARFCWSQVLTEPRSQGTALLDIVPATSNLAASRNSSSREQLRRA